MTQRLHVGIIADLHDHLVNFTQLLAAVSFDELWIAGDLGTPETLEAVCQQFLGPIRIVPGNVEIDHGLPRYAQLRERFPHLIWADQSFLRWDLAGFLITLSHRPVLATQPADPSGQRQVLISGHTHRPALNHTGAIWQLNPGTLGGVFFPATYVQAVFPGAHFRLRRLYQV